MLTEEFGTEEACINFLIKARWGGTPTCPQCGCTEHYYLKTRKIYKCKSCSKQYSVTQGLLFHRSKVPLTKWFKLIYFFTTHAGVPSNKYQEDLGLPQQTVHSMLQRLRCALKNQSEGIKLKGICEIDEKYFGPSSKDLRAPAKRRRLEEKENEVFGMTAQKMRKKYGTSKGYKAQVKTYDHDVQVYSKCYGAVLGIKERGGPTVLIKIGSSGRGFTKKKIMPILIELIDKDAIIITDESRLYKNQNYFPNHFTVNHKKKQYVDKKNPWIHTQGIESGWNHLNRLIHGRYMHVHFRHIQKYLDEYTYRANVSKQSSRFKFENFIQTYVLQSRPKDDEMTAKGIIWIEAA
jgi:transposase-like protein